MKFIELRSIIASPLWPIINVHFAKRYSWRLFAVGIQELAKLAIHAMDIRVSLVIEMELGVIFN